MVQTTAAVEYVGRPKESFWTRTFSDASVCASQILFEPESDIKERIKQTGLESLVELWLRSWRYLKP